MQTDIREVSIDRPVQIRAGSVTLEGNLAIPSVARGIVLFAHGSGSSRHSSRNRFVVEKQLELVAGATHLFEEPGTLAQAAQLALRWFQKYLV